jgi:hypothetical protein
MVKEPCIYSAGGAIEIAKYLNEGDDDLTFVVEPMIGNETAHIKIFDDEMNDRGYIQCQQ